MAHWRFKPKYLDHAVANEVISPQDREEIEKFYYSDTFILKDLDAVEKLKSVIPDVVVDHDSERDLYSARVVKWPHIKEMCLRNYRRKPREWLYMRKDYQKVLFRYSLDEYSIETFD